MFSAQRPKCSRRFWEIGPENGTQTCSSVKFAHTRVPWAPVDQFTKRVLHFFCTSYFLFIGSLGMIKAWISQKMDTTQYLAKKKKKRSSTGWQGLSLLPGTRYVHTWYLYVYYIRNPFFVNAHYARCVMREPTDTTTGIDKQTFTSKLRNRNKIK